MGGRERGRVVAGVGGSTGRTRERVGGRWGSLA